jgi:hypothetical protein
MVKAVPTARSETSFKLPVCRLALCKVSFFSSENKIKERGNTLWCHPVEQE